MKISLKEPIKIFRIKRLLKTMHQITPLVKCKFPFYIMEYLACSNAITRSHHTFSIMGVFIYSLNNL